MNGEETIKSALTKREKRSRLETSLILILCILVGWFSSFLLLRAGLDQIWVRYLVCCVTSYTLFVVLYWLWMKYVIKEVREFINGGQKAFEDNPKTSSSGGDTLSSVLNGIGLEEIGLFFGILVILVVCVVFVVISPALLVDVFTSELIVLFVLKKVNSIPEKAIFTNILQHTWVLFMILTSLVVVWALALELFFPGTNSLSDVLRMWANGGK